MKCSDVVPEAGCHYLFETLTTISFQMAGCMPFIQWKCHSFPVIAVYFHCAGGGRQGPPGMMAAESRQLLTELSQLIPCRSGQTAGDTTQDTPKSSDTFNLTGKWF